LPFSPIDPSPVKILAVKVDSFVKSKKKGLSPKVFSIKYLLKDTFEKCSILFKFKAGENFNRRNTLSILRIKI
jgi:hypothetical protein